jgi:hypothetical protein
LLETFVPNHSAPRNCCCKPFRTPLITFHHRQETKRTLFIFVFLPCCTLWKLLNFLASYEILTWRELPFLASFTLEGHIHHDRCIPRAILQDYSHLAFKCLLDSGNDQSLLNACGCNHASFRSLVQLFEPIYDSHFANESLGFIQPVATMSTRKRKGRTRHLDAAGCLGLVLMWYRTRGAVSRSLCIMFGLTQTVMHRSLKFGKRVLLLQGHPDAKIQKPTAAQVLSYSNSISTQYHHVLDVWAACDGLKLTM